MDIVALRIFTYSILPLIVAVAQIGVDKSIRSRERKDRDFLAVSLWYWCGGKWYWWLFGHVFISTRSPIHRLGRPGILFSLRSALPIWQSVFLELSRWAAAMGSVRQLSLR